MSIRMTSRPTRNATSSPASVDGPTQLDWLDILMIGNSGQAVNHASPTVLQGKASEKPTNVISDRMSTASSLHEDRVSTWENRLRLRLARIGSTECTLTWKASATPAGRLLFRLVPSMRPIDEIVCGLWPTPQVADVNLSRMPDTKAYSERWLARKNSGSNLAPYVQAYYHGRLSMWTTPSARDWKDSAGMATTGTNPDGSMRSRLDQLPRQAALYPTPRSADGEKNVRSLDGTLREIERKGSPQDTCQAAQITQAGQVQSGQLEQTEKPGALNPAFVCWLMGFPPEWESCAPTATPSSRKSRQK